MKENEGQNEVVVPAQASCLDLVLSRIIKGGKKMEHINNRDKEKRNCSSGGGELGKKEIEHRWTPTMKDFGWQLLTMFKA